MAESDSLFRAELPSELDFPAFLMNFPFTVDNRDDNNALMEEGAAPYNMTRAFRQFMKLYSSLASDGLVYVLPSGGDYQDLPFVANLGLCPPNKPKTLVLANFTSPPRKGEVKVGRPFFEQMGFEVIQPDGHWEGEADLKFVRDNLYVGGVGQRSEKKAFDWIAEKIGAEIVQIKLSDEKLYHLDCSFCPLSGDRAMVATSALDVADVRKIERIVDIVDVPYEFIYDGWTNAVMVGGRFLHDPARNSPRSDAALGKVVERYGFELEIIDLSEFAKSGADCSCLVMHFNAMNRKPSARRRRSALLYQKEPDRG